MDQTKIEALVQRTVVECENENLTVADAVSFVDALRTRISSIANASRHHYAFKDFGDNQGSPNTDACTR